MNLKNVLFQATYGNNPLNSFQGTLIEKKLLQEIGLFIPKIRSGEDAEWINRSKCFYPRMIQSEVIHCKYIGLKGMNFLNYVINGINIQKILVIQDFIVKGYFITLFQ